MSFAIVFVSVVALVVSLLWAFEHGDKTLGEIRRAKLRHDHHAVIALVVACYVACLCWFDLGIMQNGGILLAVLLVHLLLAKEGTRSRQRTDRDYWRGVWKRAA